MFTPIVDYGRNSSTTIDVKDPVSEVYARTLVPVRLEDVSLLEFVHTMNAFTPIAAATDLSLYVANAAGVRGVYRDAARVLVLEYRQDERRRLQLLWPVARLVAVPTPATTVRAAPRGAVFVLDSGIGAAVPLPAVAPEKCALAWGYLGAGPTNLYYALVYVVTGKTAPAPLTKFTDDPRSLLGWIIRLDRNAGFEIAWPDLVRRVQDDEPLRLASR